ncbi:MAG: mannose-6-phosphate isomerase [Verrucomicrobiales bacterium]|jgi:mannose-6-phosphate isomerase
MSISKPIRFRPLYMQRVWGGRSLEAVYGRELPATEVPFGESWELVDRPEAQSVVDGGELDGLSLHDLWSDHRDAIFGRGEGERFPLLVKVLDAREKLSIQVHPPAGVAEALGGEPKTEMWYIADAEPDAVLYVGLKSGVSKEDFVAGVAAGTTENQVHQVAAKKGESIFIPSGRLHAIGAGLLIYEIQQNSDTTYRVFDWNRVGLDGKPRDLHVDESIACIDFEDIEPGMDSPDGELLAECPEFRVERWELNEEREAAPEGQFAIIAVVEGDVNCGNQSFVSGDFFLIPASGSGSIGPRDGQAIILRTTIP